jgi:hypothetical protein
MTKERETKSQGLLKGIILLPNWVTRLSVKGKNLTRS